MKKLRVGVLGATGAVGQSYCTLLENHPWFHITYVAASPQNEGKKFGDAVRSKWIAQNDIPYNLTNLIMGNAGDISGALNARDFVSTMDKKFSDKNESYAEKIENIEKKLKKVENDISKIRKHESNSD